jgi:hypothetical protein
MPYAPKGATGIKKKKDKVLPLKSIIALMVNKLPILHSTRSFITMFITTCQ